MYPRKKQEREKETGETSPMTAVRAKSRPAVLSVFLLWNVLRCARFFAGSRISGRDEPITARTNPGIHTHGTGVLKTG
jgi:hypothetical protein